MNKLTIGEVHAFRIEVNNALKTNNIDFIKYVMNPNKHPNLTKDEKESQILSVIILALNINPFSEKFLNYLIFEYNIKESNCSYLISLDRYKFIKDMFIKREINKELNSKLVINEEKNKKTKV